MKKVYLLSREDNHGVSYKIGWTKRDPKIRLKELQTGNDKPLHLIDYYESKWATKIEKSLHNKYHSKRGKGEWFYLSDEKVLSFKNECEKIDENLEFLSKNNSFFS